jgi:Putative Ig domain
VDLYQNGVEADGVGPLGTDGAFTVTYGTPDQVTVINPGSQSTQVDAPPVSLQIRATSSTGTALSYAASGLPPGLSISSTGLITGTPTATGTYSATVTATDTKGTSGSASFTWTVIPKPAAPKPGKPKPHQCGTSTRTVVHVCWATVPHATFYSGLLYKHGHSFTTRGLGETFRGLKRNTSHRLRMWATNAAGSSAVVVLVVRTK